MEPTFVSCEAAVRSGDFDRYLTALFAPAAVRPHLFALYAFNYEVAKTAETVSQPTLGLIRLQWWRESIADVYENKIREHYVVRTLAEAVHTHALPRALFDGLIDAREKDLEDTPFAEMEELKAYAEATSGNLMQLALRIVEVVPAQRSPELERIARDAGIAYALTGLLRAFPHHAAQRRVMLPLRALNAAAVSVEDIYSGKMSSHMSALIASVAEHAETDLVRAQAKRLPRGLLPALLPAALIPLYLKRLTRRGFDPFRDLTDVPVYRRQLALLRAMARRRF